MFAGNCHCLGVDTTVGNHARVYGFLLGGNGNFAAARAARDAAI